MRGTWYPSKETIHEKKRFQFSGSCQKSSIVRSFEESYLALRSKRMVKTSKLLKPRSTKSPYKATHRERERERGEGSSQYEYGTSNY